MGVSIEAYRSRIGSYRHRCPRKNKRAKEKMVQLKRVDPDQHWRNIRNSLLVLYIFMFYAVMIFEVYYSEQSTMADTQSHVTVIPAERNIDTSHVHDWECLKSRNVWQSSTIATAEGLGNLCRQVTITGLLRLLSSGDVEENPGPPKHAEPTPVHDIKVINTTETTATVKWKPPETMNLVQKRLSSGTFVPVSYDVHVTIETCHGVTQTDIFLPKETCQRKIEGLLPDTKYKCQVTIRADGVESKARKADIETRVAPVEDFTCEGGCERITVRWKKSSISRLKLELEREVGQSFVAFNTLSCQPFETPFYIKKLPSATKFRITMVTCRKSRISRKERESVPVEEICWTGLSAPQKFKVSSVDSTTFSVQWSSGLQRSEYKGRTLTYMLRCRETGSDENSDQWRWLPIDNTECTGDVTGLNPGTKYDIEVCAKMAGVQSRWVRTDPVLTKYGSIELTKTAVTDRSITISWKWLNCPGFVVGYEVDVEKREKGKFLTKIPVGRTNSYQITGLDPASYYNISVWPQRDDGIEEIENIPSICTAPAEPVIKEACVRNGTSLELSLKYIQSAPHGQYKVWCLPANNPLGKEVMDETFSWTLQEPWVIDGLAENTEYDVRLWFVFKKHISSEVVTTRIKTGLQPVQIVATIPNDTSITIKWEGKDTSTTHHDWLYHVYILKEEELLDEAYISCENQEKTFNKLEEVTKYTIGVKVGLGEVWSEAREVHTNTLLSPPSDLHFAEGEDNTLGLTWTANDGDSFIVRYRPEGYETYEQITLGREMSTVLNNLRAATTYVIGVSAERNGIQSDFVQDSFFTRPNQVTQVQATEDTPNVIQVRWVDTQAAQNYEVSISKMISDNIFELPATKHTKRVYTQFTRIEGIRPGTAYRISVRAEYKTNQSKPATVVCRTKPMKPSSLSIDITDTTITAHWKSPDPATGILWYEIGCVDKTGRSPTRQRRVNIGDSPTSGANQLQTTDFHHIFCDLCPETDYRVSVMSASGSPDNPSYSYPLTKNVKTGPVTVEGFTAKSSSTSILIQWKPVKGHRLLYVLRYEDDPKLRVSIRKCHDPQILVQPSEILEARLNQKTFTNLQPDTKYVIIVTPLRDSEQSSAIALKTKSAESIIITVTGRTTTSISVGWEASINDNTTYTPTIEPQSGGLSNAIEPTSGDNTTCIFDGLEQGTAYKVFLKSECLTQTCETSTIPEPPKNVEIKCSDNQSLTIKWDPPDGQVDSYRVYLNPDQIPATCSIGDFGHTFPNLTPGRLYEITLESCSNGEYSSPVLKRKRMVPCKPALSVSNTTEDSITVKWDSVKGEKEDYILQLWSNGKLVSEERIQEISRTEQSCHEHVFTNLTPARNYKISAVTQIDNVTSKSCEIDAKTMVPSPKNLDVRDVGEDYITVQWSAVSGDITGFDVIIKAVAHDEEPLEYHLGAKRTSFKVTKLISGREYLISVLAVTENDRSQPLSTKQYTRVRPPGNLEVGPGTDFIRIDWSPPDGDVEWYDIEITDLFGNRVLESIEGDIKPYTETVGKLIPGTSYTVKLESRCGECPSGKPFMKQVTTIPAAPMLEVSRYDIGHEHLTVYWSEATGNVDWYIITLHPTNHGICSVPKDGERKCTFSGLTPGYAYTIKIYSEVNKTTQSCPIEQRIFTRPFAPASIDIRDSDITQTSMQVVWEQPPECEVMKWYLQISPKTSIGLSEHKIVEVQAQHSQHSLRHKFSDLRSGRLYEVGIFAESGGQCSEQKTITKRTIVGKPKIVVHEQAVGLRDITVEYEPLEGDSDSCEVIVALSTNPTAYVDGVTHLETKGHWNHCFCALTPGTEYQISAIARSGDKQSEPFTTTVRTRVDAPSDLWIIEQDQDGTTIGWSAATGCVDEYKIDLSSGGETLPQRSVSASEQLKLKFPNLVPGRMYRTSVSSVIIDQQSNVEAAKSIAVSLDFRAMVKKPNVTIDPASLTTNSLKITWHDVIGERDRYRVSISPPDSDKSEIVITATGEKELSHIFENLIPGTMYTVTAVTITGKDKSEGDRIEQRTQPAKPKLREVDSVVNDVKYFTEWDHSNGVFDKYKLTVEPVVYMERELSPQRTFEPEDNNIIVDLVPGIKYNFSLLAVSGEEYSSIETSTVTVLPARPLDVKVSSTDTTITVTWKEPEGVKTGYIVQLSSKKGETRMHEIHHVQQLQTCFTKCIRGREYRLEIYTVAGNDEEQTESPHVSRQVQTVVSQPEVCVKQTDLTSISVSWSEVDGDKTGYCLSIHGPDGQCITSREINIKGEEGIFSMIGFGYLDTFLRSNSYQEELNGLCPGRRYEIIAFTRSGDGMSDSTSVFVQTEVSPVRNILVEPSQSETGFTVKWDPVVGNVDKYIVALEASSVMDIDKAEVEETTHTFDNLKPGVKYHIRVKSVSGSKTSTEEIVSRIMRPCKAEDVSVVPNGPHSLKVSWSEAKGEKTHYVVTISPLILGSDGETTVDTGQPLVCEYSGLISGREYTITVVTFSEDVEGYPVNVPQTTIVSAPCSVFVKDRLEENLTVSWTPGEGLADRYHVRAVPVVSSGSSTTCETIVSVEHTDNVVVCPVGGLQAGTSYDIFVKAESNGHYSHESHTQASTLVGRVTEIHVSDERTESFNVSWTESHGQKTHYVLYVDPSNEIIVQQGQDTNLNYEFTGLQPGLEYKVVIRTGNETDKSEPTEIPAWTKPMPPDYVEQTSVEQDSLTVRWHHPEEGEYDKYKVSIYPADDKAVEVEREMTEHTFNGLFAGRKYVISVSTIFHSLESTPKVAETMTFVRPPTLAIQSSGISQEHVALSVMNHRCDCDEYKIMIESVESGDGYLKTVKRETDEDVHTIENLVPGRKYNISAVSVTQSQISAVNSITTRTTPAKVADILTEEMARTCTITWEEAVGDRDGYVIYLLSEQHGYKEKKFVKSGQIPLQCTFKKLTPGRIYEVSVRTASVKEDGDRATSEPKCKQVQTAVSKAKIERIGHRDTDITVQWFDVSGDKTSYKLRIKPRDGDNPIRDVPITTRHSDRRKLVYNETFTGLQPGRKYQIFCQTISGDKPSEESVIDVQTTVCPPQDVQVSTSLEHSLSVTWSHAIGDKDSYKLRLLLDKTEVASDTVSAPADETHGQLSCTFQNLNAGYEYELEISTLSGNKNSGVKRYPAQTRPSPPQHVTIAKHGTEGLTVTWHEAEGKVTCYGVDISPTDGWKRHQEQLNPAGCYEWTYSRLAPGRKYIVSVTTLCGVAESQSVVIEEITVVAIPENVQVVDIEETSLTLGWNPAEGDKGGYLTTIEPLVSDPSSNEVISTDFLPHRDGHMSHTFENLQPGRKYVMTLKTESCGHYSEEVIVKARALVSPPKTLQVTNTTTNNMTLTWSDADGDKDYYKIRISPADGPNPTGNVKKGEDTSYTFSGLTPGKRYDVSIRTVSGGAQSQRETISDRTFPNAPGSVVPKIVGKGIMVYWQPVEGELDSYLLHLKPYKDTRENRDEVWHTVGKDDLQNTSHIFADLIFGRLYVITVQTVSGNRKSSPFKLRQRLTIDPPKALKETGREERSIAVAWEPATGDKDCYRVQLHDRNGLLQEEHIAETTWSFDGLIPGTLYTICVQTVCEEETSEQDTTHIRTVACSPSSVDVENVTESTISIRWPDADGNKDEYSVQICDEKKGIIVGSTVVASTVLGNTFKQLTPGRLYHIHIKTLSGDDDLSTSKPVSELQRTKVATPGNIYMDNVELDHMTLSWEEALGDVDHYIVAFFSSDPDENIPKLDPVGSERCLESTVGGLTAGRLYTISVMAVSGGDNGKPRELCVRTKVGKPREPRIVAVGENILVVTWDHAVGDKDRYMLKIDSEHSTGMPVHVESKDELMKTFTNLVPGTFYNISFTTIKSDRCSELSSCAGWTRPLPPSKMRLSHILEKSITVSWDHVSEGGYEKYRVAIDPDDAGKVTLFGDNQKYVFKDLTPGREYTVTVVTICGDYLMSKRNMSKIRTNVNTPNLTIQSPNVTKNCIPVRWTRSEGDCDKYKLTIYTEKDETERQSIAIPNESCFEYMFNGLVPGREYTVSLVAFSGRGHSKPSRRPQRTTVAITASLNLSSTEDCIAAEWEKAEGDAAGYLLTLSSTFPADEEKKKFIGSDEALKTSFNQLVPGRIYTIKVHTVVKPIHGDDVFSSPLSHQKRTEVKPPELKVDTVTKTSIRVKWPDVNGDRDEYRLQVSPTDQSPVRLPVAAEKSFQDKHHTFSEGLVPGKSYEISAVTVSGDQDSKVKTINVRTLICPPMNIRSESTRTEITVQWDELEGEYDGFYLQLSPSDAQQSELSKEKGELCHSFTNLVSGRKYMITIVTMNEGERSEAVTISIQTKVAEPAELFVVPDGDGKLRATWKHCEGDKRGYLIMISPNDTTSSPTRFINSNSPLESIFIGLVPGRMYSITLCAVSHKEQSKGTIQKVRATVAPPQGTCIDTKTERSMSVSWNGSEGEVDGYLVSISDESATLTEVCIKNKGAGVLMSYMFQELTPGRMYNVSITAIREDDSSLTRSPKPSRTDVSQPNDVKIVDETIDSIRVCWSESDGCKDRYHIEILDAHGPQDGHHRQRLEEVVLQRGKVDANNNPQYAYMFGDLTAGKGYCLRVLAESGNDKSSWATTFGRTIPLPPEGIEAGTREDTEIEIRWKPGNGEYDQHKLFLYSEKVPEGVVSDKELLRSTDSQTASLATNRKDNESEIIQKRWVDIERTQESAHTFSDLEHGRLYVIRITTKSGDKESEPRQVMIRTTVDVPKKLRETSHDETCIAIEWKHARGVKDNYILKVTSNNCLVESHCVEADGPLECRFEGLYPGRLYAVSVKTSCGESLSKPIEGYMRTTAIPPDEITIDEDDVTERAITITWPEAQCDKDHYRVTLFPEGYEDQGKVQEEEITSDVHKHSFRELVPGQLYNISICTLSDRKESESRPVVIQRRTRVAKANNLRVSKVDFTSLSVEWESADGVQDGYQIDLNHDGQQQQSKPVDKVSPLKVVFDNLAEGRLYTVDVITISGDEKVTTWISQRTKVRPPSKVHIIRQDTVGASQDNLTVSWTRPSGDLSGYKLDIFDCKNNILLEEMTVCTKNTRYTFRGLVAGRMYRIRVWTLSGDGHSDLESVHERTIPRPPDDVQIPEQDVTLNSLKVNWMPPTDSDEDCYLLSIHNTKGHEKQVVEKPRDTLEHTFHNLTAGTEYKLSAQSISAKGSTSMPNGERRSIQIEKQQMTLVSKPILHIDEKDPDQIQKKALVLTWKPGEGKTDAYRIRISPFDKKKKKSAKTLMVDMVESPCTNPTCLHRGEDQTSDASVAEGERHYHYKVDNLECLTEYEVTMEAISYKEKQNDDGTREFRQSNEKAHWITFTRPDPPQREKIYCGNESYDSFMLYWQPPKDQESRRTVHNYKIRYQDLSSENMPATQLYSQGNTQVKIENKAANAQYRIEIVSITKVSNHDNIESEIESEPVKVKYRTLSWMKNIARYVTAGVIQIAIIIIVLTSLGNFLGTWIGNCVGTNDRNRRNVDVYPTLLTNSTPTAGTETPAPSVQSCFREKAWIQFVTFLAMLSIWIIVSILTIICWICLNKWIGKVKMVYNDEEETVDGAQRTFVEAREIPSDLSDEEIAYSPGETPDDDGYETVPLLRT